MIKTINNIIPAPAQQRLISLVNSRDFKWYYRRNSAYSTACEVQDYFNDMPTAGFVSPVFVREKFEDELITPYCQQIIDGLYEHTGIEVNELLRINFNLLYQHPSKSYTVDSWNSAHTDQTVDHKVLLYYVNDSDGDTFLFDQTLGSDFNSFTVKQRISPKQGSALLFSGNYYHSSSNPINSFKRFTINFNFV